MAPVDLNAFTDADLHALAERVDQERSRRERVASAPVQVEQIVAAAAAAGVAPEVIESAVAAGLSAPHTEQEHP